MRVDQNDQVFKTDKEKYQAILNDIKDCAERGQPVLVGTTSIENSELLSAFLKKEGLQHEVLNAKQHEREAHIVANAGKPGSITIATNMAGRGTDIVLGGAIENMEEWLPINEQVKAAGGLRIIGTERHDSRRIDNQLRGRAGRQGDPGSSRFYLSLDDSLMRIFAGDRVRAIMERLRLPEGEPIEARMVTRSIESAQRKVEARNFDMRKQLLEYDDVANDQRKVIYTQRNEVLESADISETIGFMREASMADYFHKYVPQDSMEEQWDIKGLQAALASDYQLQLDLVGLVEKETHLAAEDVLDHVLDASKAALDHKVELVGAEQWGNFERAIMLQAIDTQWRGHLQALDHLRQGIHLRGYAQKDPKQEYKREAFELFSELLDRVRDEVIKTLLTVQIQAAPTAETAPEPEPLEGVAFHEADYDTAVAKAADAEAAVNADEVPRVGRNQDCPCGSGKKYKHCHGRLA